jgi:hypothetical protein
MAEGQALLANDNDSPDDVRHALVGIKTKYRVDSLELVTENQNDEGETDHIEGAMSPTKKGASVKKGQKDQPTKAFTISRPSFITETLEALQEAYPDEHKKGKDPLLKKGLARRHIVSSQDMAEHYQTSLIGKLWSIGKGMLLKGSGNAVTQITGRLSHKAIADAAKTRHKNFFNYTENLFVGDKYRNSSIGRALDTEKPGMGVKKLNDHIAKIKKEWAMGPLSLTVIT